MENYKFILVGKVGSGKTAQFATMPKPRFAYLFDPASESTLEGIEFDKEWFLPEINDSGMKIKSIIKGGKSTNDNTGKHEPLLYNRWVDDFNARLKSGFFNDYKTVMLDSATLLGQACLDRARYVHDALGRDDERVDHRVAGDAMTNSLYHFLSLPCHMIVTVHSKKAKDGDEIVEKLTIPGGSQLTAPRLVSCIWYCESKFDRANGITNYSIYTKNDSRHTLVRTARKFADLPPLYDVTIKNWNTPEKYGIGALLNGKH